MHTHIPTHACMHAHTHTNPTLTRSEWLDMKKVYRNLQKEHMKQLKSETKSAEGSGAGGGREGRGFVARCLVKVVCTGEEKVSAEQLQVSLLCLKQNKYLCMWRIAYKCDQFYVKI